MRSHREIRLSGTGGQGLQLAAQILAMAFNREGQLVSLSQSYEPTSRGGLSRADLVVGENIADYPLITALDRLVILDEWAARASDGLIADGALVLVDDTRVQTRPQGPFTVHAMPFVETALALGNVRVANIVALGALAGFGGLGARHHIEEAARARVPARFTDLNLEALAAGYDLADALAETKKPIAEVAAG